MVPWEASNNEAILNEARWEIARSVAWGLGEEPPPKGDGKAILDYLQTKAPPVYRPVLRWRVDPAGGAAIGVARLWLGPQSGRGADRQGAGRNPAEIRGHAAGEPEGTGGSCNRAADGTAEARRASPRTCAITASGCATRRRSASGISIRRQKLPDGSEATVIAWLWARTVRSPDPAAKGAMVPLVSSFMLSTKEGQEGVGRAGDRPHRTGRLAVRGEATELLSKADEENG